MRDVPCEIIEDLMPLVVDDVCSEESRETVEEHLVHCKQCQLKWQRMKADLPIAEKKSIDATADDRVIKGMASTWKKGKKKSFLKGVFLSALSIAVLLLAYVGLFEWQITSVPADNAEITDVGKTEDGKIMYHLNINDGYSVNTLKYSMGDDGNFYITAKRPVVKEEAQPPFALEKGYDSIDIPDQESFRGQKIKAIYFGTPKDRTLIWKKGMDLPDASEEAKERFGF
ncbi:zf-HC2 domain-containing protein [Rossellomorea aquimaris]|uniref:zf-HC2 domain-containing protein n=1 Tax=Rossellomorea aquimaris TaxID=189382 RepID=UPI001CFD32EC|nr:zf-HC2 domain-containing protein [Rossellomorea aquimaris]